MDGPYNFRRDVRGEHRAYCAHQVSVLAKSGTRAASLLDISRSGFRASVDAPVSVGDAVTLTISQDRELSALVVWQKDSEIGCRFDEPISKVTVLSIFQGYGLSGDQSSAGYADANALGR